MYTRKNCILLISTLFSVIFSLLSFGCTTTDKDDAVEYYNTEVSYADAESCAERYILNKEDGKYERYIAGMYFGKELPGIYFGTLFETGTYSKDEGRALNNIKFSPKKQYDFDSKKLEYLGLEKQIPYYGTLTDSTLTITWNVWSGFSYAEVPITYKRK